MVKRVYSHDDAVFLGLTGTCRPLAPGDVYKKPVFFCLENMSTPPKKRHLKRFSKAHKGWYEYGRTFFSVNKDEEAICMELYTFEKYGLELIFLIEDPDDFTLVRAYELLLHAQKKWGGDISNQHAPFTSENTPVCR